MSEKTETEVKKAPAKPHPPRKQRDGSSGAFLAMIIALGAAGGSYYIWQQHLVAEQDRLVLEQSIEALLKVVEQKDQAQLARIEQLRQHQHSEVEQRIATLEHSLPQLNQQLNRQLTIQQQQWTLAEVDYLLRTAENRLQLNRDIPTAISALIQAGEQLKHYTNGDFSGVIAAIEQQITSLEQLEQDGPGHIINQLGGLIGAVESLPVVQAERGEALAATPPERPVQDAELAEKAKYWGRMIWHDIKSLVTIRHSDDTSVPMLNTQQQLLLQSELRIKLETARQAALNHNQSLYVVTLAEAGELIGRYFDSSDNGVSGAQATLEQLSALQVDTPLPSLLELRQQLHAVTFTGEVERSVPVEVPTELPTPEVLPEVTPELIPESIPAPTAAPAESPAPAQPDDKAAAPQPEPMPPGVAPAQSLWGDQP